MARIIDVPATTVQGWNKRGVIPGSRRELIVKRAGEENIKLDDLFEDPGNEKPDESENNQNTGSGDIDMSKIPNVLKPDVQLYSGEKQEFANSGNPDKLSGSSETGNSGISSRNADYNTGEENVRTQASKPVRKGKPASDWKIVFISFWISLILFLLIAAAGIYYIMPKAEDYISTIDRNVYRLESLETEVSNLEERIQEVEKIDPSGFKGLVPGNLSESLNSLKDQTSRLDTTVKNLQDRANRLRQDFEEKLRDNTLVPEAQELTERLGSLEMRMDEIVGDLTGAQAPEGNDTDLYARFQTMALTESGRNSLSSALRELDSLVQQGSGTGNFSQIIQQATGPVSEVFKGISPQDFDRAALSAAAAQYTASVRNGQPFEHALAVIRQFGGNMDGELNTLAESLEPVASQGVNTSDRILQKLEDMREEIVNASLQQEGQTLKDKAQASLNAILTVEKNGELLTGTQTQKVINRAKQDLNKSDYQAALNTLQSLDGQALEKAKPLIDDIDAAYNARRMEQKLKDLFTSFESIE